MRARNRGSIAFLAVVATVGLLAAACGGSSNDKKSSSGDNSSSKTTLAPLAAATLNGSGSTFQKPFIEEVSKDFKGTQSAVTVNYAGGGSGKGRQDLADQVTDFAGSDGLPKPEDLPKFKGGGLL